MNEPGEREAFHAAIWQSPDDDLPRLVYADWLDERNEPDAAAFLRLLCAVRTCPPDVDKLRPLVAQFRRAMFKLSPKWIDAVCPVSPAVVVGAWVDVDHEANREALEKIRKARREWTWDESSERQCRRLPSWNPSDFIFVEMVWETLRAELSLAAACEIDGVPALVDVWSGVVMAVAMNAMWCEVRTPAGMQSRWSIHQSGQLGPWADLLDCEPDAHQFRQVVAEFDPANQSASATPDHDTTEE